MIESRSFTYETLAELNTWASQQATSHVGLDTDYSNIAYVDLGNGRTSGVFVVDVTAITKPVAGNNFNIVLEGSLNSSFTSAVPLALVQVGDSGATGTLTIFIDEDQGTGRYWKPFTNDYGGTIYRYVRAYLTVGGTPATGIAYKAFLSRSLP